MIENLKEKAATGILWKFAEQGGVQFIQFASGIYIARLLLPEHYGLIGMMTIFLGFSQVFIDSGFKVALIQKGQEVTQDDYNVVFYFNLAVSILFCLLIYLGAPVISRFYNEPALIPVARALAFNLVLGSPAIIHMVIFEKKLNFRTNTKIRLLSVVLSAIIGVVLAKLNYGVWALVLMLMTETTLRTFLYFIINKWRPNLSFKMSSFVSLFSNGSKILLNGILAQINQNIYSLIIGRYFTTVDVGFYSQGRKIQQRITDFMMGSVQGVMFPVMSLIKDDSERLKRSVRKNVVVSSFIAGPAIIGLIAIAKPFIVLFLTEKWLASVYYLQVLSVAGILLVVNQSIKSYLKPLGKFNFLLVYGIIANIVLMLMIVICIYFKAGMKWIVAIKVLHEFLNFIATIFISKYFINYRVSEIVRDLFPSTLCSLIMGIVVYFIGVTLGISFWVLGLQVFVGAGTYMLTSFLFNKSLFNEFLGIAIQQILKRK